MLSDLAMRNSGVKLMQRELIVAMPREEIIKEHVVMAEDKLSSYALPNPIPKGENLHIVIASPEDDPDAEIALMDFSGRVLSSESFSLQKGKNVHNFTLQNYPSGTYIVRIISGENQTVERIVKE